MPYLLVTRLCFVAAPAEHVEHVGGWWLRHSTSCTW